MTDDEQHLDVLAIFHYIVAGITALFSCFPLLHVALGLAMILGTFDEPNPPPALFGWVFVIGGGIFVLCGWAMAAAIFLAGRRLKKRTSRTYCIVIGALECMMIPLGTVLGVFTIIVLMKESVAARFSASQTLPAVGGPGAASA